MGLLIHGQSGCWQFFLEKNLLNCVQRWMVDLHTGPCGHYSDVRMSILASQIIDDSTVCLTVCLDRHQRKQPRRCYWPVARKTFPFDDGIICVGIFRQTKRASILSQKAFVEWQWRHWTRHSCRIDVGIALWNIKKKFHELLMKSYLLKHVMHIWVTVP